MRTLSLICAAVLAAASALTAASVPQMSLEHVVRNSPRAVHGTVARSWSAWDDDRSAIWTHYEIQVTETLRGSQVATLIISEPGGVVGDVAMHVPGAPRLALGEEAILFAYPTPLSYWRVKGWGQGRYLIEEQNGRKVVRAPRLDAAIVDGGGAAGPAGAVLSRPVDGEGLDAFLNQVRTLIRDEAGR